MYHLLTRNEIVDFSLPLLNFLIYSILDSIHCQRIWNLLCFSFFELQGIEQELKIEYDWSSEGLLDVKPHPVLHDKLMSDAVMGVNVPIKTEHSYCTRIFNPDDDNSQDSNSTNLHKIQDGKRSISHLKIIFRRYSLSRWSIFSMVGYVDSSNQQTDCRDSSDWR